MNTQELYLLGLYVSPEYLMSLRDTWGCLVSHVEKCLREYERALSPGHRSKHLSQQADIVWGERILPNFRSTFQGLCDGYVRLTHGEFQGLLACYGPLSDFKGQSDFDPSWMTDQDLQIYGDLLALSVRLATNIRVTVSAAWDPFELSTEYNSNTRGPLTLPTPLPIYKRTTVSVQSGSLPQRSGLYLPDQSNTSAQFLLSSKVAPEARVFLRKEPLFHPDTGAQYAEQNIIERRACTWTLVEQAAPDASRPSPTIGMPQLHGVVGGTPCPSAGFYFTPARAGSRSYFSAGEVMPTFDTEYGTVIWQWDLDQQ